MTWPAGALIVDHKIALRGVAVFVLCFHFILVLLLALFSSVLLW